jgi:hypothetical protein
MSWKKKKEWALPGNPKSETRNPNEIRNQKSETADLDQSSVTRPGSRSTAVFGFRVWDFIRISGFGFRAFFPLTGSPCRPTRNRYTAPSFESGDAMALDLKTNTTIKVTISKTINRAAARKTVERLFMKDKTVVAPLDARSKNFIPLPKRRGGCIWTKRVNKIHPTLVRGESATIVATPQAIRDLNSVADFVTTS